MVVVGVVWCGVCVGGGELYLCGYVLMVGGEV